MDYIALTLIILFALNIAANVAVEVRRRKDKKTIANINEANVAKVSDMFYDVLTTSFKGTNAKLDEVLKELKNTEWDYGGIPKVPSFEQPMTKRKVYAVIAARGYDTRLVMHPAEKLEEMQEFVEKQLGKGWLIVSSANVEVSAPLVSEAPKVEEKKEKEKEKGLTNYVSVLEYAKDKFTTTPAQRRTIENIISNVKNHYGRSNSTTA